MEIHLIYHSNNFNNILILCFSYFLIQGAYSSQYSDPHYNYYSSAYSNSYPRYSASYYRSKYQPPSIPLTEHKTEYGFETIQSGSAYVNPYQKDYVPVRVGPDKDQTKHNFVTINTATHYLPSSARVSQLQKTPEQGQINRSVQFSLPSSSSSLSSLPSATVNRTVPQYPYHHQQHSSRRHHRRHHHRSSNGGECIKCPSEKIIIAQKGLDGVLIDPPKLFSCQNRLILNGIYYIDTLFGSQFQFLLPHGTHSFHAKIRSKRNPKFEQPCILRYKVVVQQCGRYYPQNENLRIKCDPGYIWGSKCHFVCRRGYLSHNEPMICGDSLKWEGDEPECLSDPAAMNRYATKSCDFIEIPENGKFSCQYPSNVNGEDYDNELMTPEGTICRVTCNRNYEIPSNLMPYSVLRCENGRWNSTAQGLCVSKFRQRY